MPIYKLRFFFLIIFIFNFCSVEEQSLVKWIPYDETAELEDNSKNVLALIESRDGCLLLMNHNLWSKKVNKLLKDGSDEQRRFWIGLSDTPEIDRSGRVLINSVLRNGAGINKEIILLGVGKHLEIWDESNLHNHKIRLRRYFQHPFHYV